VSLSADHKKRKKRLERLHKILAALSNKSFKKPLLTVFRLTELQRHFHRFSNRRFSARVDLLTEDSAVPI
jgi:hypothetical protein